MAKTAGGPTPMNTEIVSDSQRHIGVYFHAQAMGVEFKCTLNQEVLFSSPLPYGQTIMEGVIQ